MAWHLSTLNDICQSFSHSIKASKSTDLVRRLCKKEDPNFNKSGFTSLRFPLENK